MRRISGVDVMLFTTVVLWAFNITVTRYVLTHGFLPVAYGSIRYGAAAILFAALTLAIERSLAVGGRRNLAMLAAAAFLLLLNQFAFVYALKLASGTTVALILGTTPIFTALISFALGVERPTRRLWAGATVTFGGVALGGLSTHLGGELLALGMAATWAAYSVLIAPLMRRYSPFRISAVVLLVMEIPLLLVGSSQLGDQRYGSLSWIVWLALAFAVVGPLVLTNVLYFRSIQRIGPSRATLVTNLQPFVAAVFAFLILSERIGALQFAGGGLILAGILLERARRPVAAPVD
jgi:drug/metabolite transporter (DMT)-like permease